MKKLFLTTMMILCVASLHAQKVTKGSFSALAKENSICVIIDYSDAKIHKVPFDVFIEGEEDWERDYHDILIKFVKAANKESRGIKYTSKETPNYHLVFKAIKVDKDGETKGSLILMDKDDNVIGVAETFNANGGSFGSQTNLMGDASERLGKKVASFLKSQIKKVK